MATKISIFTPFRLRVGSMFACIVISVAAYVVRIHKVFVKATTLLILTWLFGTCMVARQQQKNAYRSVLKPKVLF